MCRIEVSFIRQHLRSHPHAPGGSLSKPGSSGTRSVVLAWGTRDRWENWSRTPPRGAELRGKTPSVFEANIWTISRLCLNEASTVNS